LNFRAILRNDNNGKKNTIPRPALRITTTIMIIKGLLAFDLLIVIVNCDYFIIHSRQGFSGIIYNTGWGTLPDCLGCSLQIMNEMSDNARLYECELDTDHYTQDYVHYSLRKVRGYIVCGFCNISQNVLYVQGCKQRPTGRPYPKRLESLTVCRYHYKGSTFSSVISLKALSVSTAGV